ncbi:MAG: response regulator [Bdellovibrionota bacterium]
MKTRAATRTNKARVAIVDDSFDMRELLQEYLSGCGIEAIGFEGVSEALEFLTSAKSRSIKLVLCDLNFPEQSGLVLLRRMRTLHPEIPVILMSAFADRSAVDRMRSEGAAAYVNKTDGLGPVLGAIERGLAFSGAPSR